MQTLRSLHWLARLVLAWFVMSIGMAVASPLVRPQTLQLICSGSGAIELLVKTDDGAGPTSGHTLDCPLCLQVGPPPARSQADRPMPAPCAQGLRARAATHRVARAAAPLPPRGPPALS